MSVHDPYMKRNNNSKSRSSCNGEAGFCLVPTLSARPKVIRNGIGTQRTIVIAVRSRVGRGAVRGGIGLQAKRMDDALLIIMAAVSVNRVIVDADFRRLTAACNENEHNQTAPHADHLTHSVSSCRRFHTSLYNLIRLGAEKESLCSQFCRPFFSDIL